MLFEYSYPIISATALTIGTCIFRSILRWHTTAVISTAIMLFLSLKLLFAGKTFSSYGLTVKNVIPSLLWGLFSCVAIAIFCRIISPHEIIRMITHANRCSKDSIVILASSPWDLAFDQIKKFICVAIPEELFYRGYLQESLARGSLVKNRSHALHKLISFSDFVAIVIASIFFSLGHYVVDWNITSFLTFFPSLLFGYIFYQTNNILCVSFVHWFSNMMFYFSS